MQLKKAFLHLTFLGLCTSAFAQASDPTLIGYWAFDEASGNIALDSTGSFPGQVVNTERVAGRVGAGALRFNGVDSRVIVGGQGTALQLVGTPYTIAWWQKWDGLNGGHQCIIVMNDGADLSGGYQAYLRSDSANLGLVNASGGDAGEWLNVTIADANWHYYALTFDGSTRRFYRDGSLVGSLPSSPMISDGDDPLVFGAMRLQSGTYANFYKGTLDEIRIYKRALSAEEIVTFGPPPELNIDRQPVGYRAGNGATVDLSVSATVQGTTSPVQYQWEKDRVPIPNATNPTLTTTATAGITSKFRVLVSVGTLQKYSDEVELIGVSPSAGRMLLRLEFESLNNGTLLDTTGQFGGITAANVTLVPGRIGIFAAQFDYGYVKVPAAGTDLELVGSSYTISWWMKTPGGSPAANQQIYNLGDPAQNRSGYAARMQGSTSARTVFTEHRNNFTTSLSGANRVYGLWQHVAVVYNGASRTIYTNGVLSATSTANLRGIIGSGRDDLFIGAATPTTSFTVSAIDDFRVYNFALATSEITALVNEPSPSFRIFPTKTTDGIVLQWVKEEGTSVRVERANTLQTPTDWEPLSTPIETTPFYYQVKDAAGSGNYFYRLRKL